MSDDPILAALARLEAGIVGLVTRDEVAKLRTDMMARMDRLQDAATQHSRDIGALLDLMIASNRSADEAREGVRRAHDIGASNTSVLTDLLKRVHQLEADVRELRDGR